MRLEVDDYRNEAEWRWILYDDRGKFIADHEVLLDVTEAQFRGYLNVAEYLDYYDPITKPDVQLEELGAWIGRHIFGRLGQFLLVEHQPPVTVVPIIVPTDAQELLFRPFELAHFEDGQSIVKTGIRFVYQLQDKRVLQQPKEESKRYLRILSVFSLPVDTNPLNLRRERHELQNLVNRLRRTRDAAIHLRVLQYGATRDTLYSALEEAEGWDIIHIAGHGDRGELLLEDQDGQVDRIKSDDLSKMLQTAQRRLKLLILDSCYSGAATLAAARAAVGLARLPTRHGTEGSIRLDRNTPTMLPSLAQDLAQQLDCAALAMRYPVGDTFATDLMLALYEKLLDKRQALPAALQLALRTVLDSDKPKPPLSVATPILFGPRAEKLALVPPIRRRKVQLLHQGLIAFPPEPKRFVGRLQPMLRASQAFAPGSNYRGVIFYGMPGAGKTACALELAHRHNERRFTGYVWYQAPERDHDISTALADFLLSVESQLDEPNLGLLAYLDDPEQFRRLTLPRFRNMLEEYSILFVLDNVDGLLTSNDNWRDPLWHDVIEVFLSHNGLSRLVITVRSLPTTLTADNRVHRESIHALTFAESVLLAREMTSLAKLFASEDGRRLLQRILRLVQGHPKLLEMADGLAKEQDVLLKFVEDMEAAVTLDDEKLDTFFGNTSSHGRLGETLQPERVFIRTLKLWTKRLERRLSDDGRLFLYFLACLEVTDRFLNVVAAVWPNFLNQVRTTLPETVSVETFPLSTLQDALKELVENSLVTTLKYRESRDRKEPPITYISIHPVIDESIRNKTEKVVSDAVDRVMGDFWVGGYLYAEELEMFGGSASVVDRGLRAVPYLLRSKRWVELSRTLDRIVQRNEAPTTLQFTLPLLRKIIKETGRTNTKGILAVVLRKLHRIDEAEAIERARIEQCVLQEDYQLAFVATGHLFDMLIQSGRRAEARHLLEKLHEYRRAAALGPWADVAIRLRDLDLSSSTEQRDRLLNELEKLGDEIRNLPRHVDGVSIWNLYETSLSRAVDAAVELSQWEKALTFSAELTAQKEARNASVLEIARSKMKAFRPLLELERYETVRTIAQYSRRIFSEAGTIFDLAGVYHGLAELELRMGNSTAAIRFQEVALRYSYQTGDTLQCGRSHYNLADLRYRLNDDLRLVTAHSIVSAVLVLKEEAPLASAPMKLLAAINIPAIPPSFQEVATLVERVPGVEFRKIFLERYADDSAWESLTTEIWAATMKAAIETSDGLLSDLAHAYVRGDEAWIDELAESFRELAAKEDRPLPEPIERILDRDADIGSLIESASGTYAVVYKRFYNWLAVWNTRLALRNAPGVLIVRVDTVALSKAVAAVARGDHSTRNLIEPYWKVIAEAGYPIRESVQHIWDGERDVATLTKGLDSGNQRLIRRILNVVHSDESLTTVERPPVVFEIAFHETMAQAIAAVTADNAHDIRQSLDDFLAMLPEDKEQLADAVQQIRAGAREPGPLVKHLDESDARLVHRVLQILSGKLEQAEEISEPQTLIVDIEQLVEGVVRTALGNEVQRALSEHLLFGLEAAGWHIYDPVVRIWNGERNRKELCQELDELDAELVIRILEQIEAQTYDSREEGV